MRSRLVAIFAATPRRRYGWQLALFAAWAFGIALTGLYDATTGRPWVALFRSACWLGMCAFAAFACRRAYQAAIARERTERGRCPACGYDLRGSPGRCPECGAEPAAKA